MWSQVCVYRVFTGGAEPIKITDQNHPLLDCIVPEWCVLRPLGLGSLLIKWRRENISQNASGGVGPSLPALRGG